MVYEKELIGQERKIKGEEGNEGSKERRKGYKRRQHCLHENEAVVDGSACMFKDCPEIKWKNHPGLPSIASSSGSDR